MKYLDVVRDQIQGRAAQVSLALRSRVLGANNERLDLLVDSFNKLSPEHRNYVLFGVGGASLVTALLGVALYFNRVGSLQYELDESFRAVRELKMATVTFQEEDQRVEGVVGEVESRTRSLRMKPFFEELGNRLGITIEGIVDQKVPLAADNPLSSYLQESRVELRLPRISIPKLMTLLLEIERSGNYLRITDLQIKARFGDKLFFDVQAKIRGYSPVGA